MAQNISSFEARYHQKHNAVTLGTDQQTQQPITVSLEDLHSGTTITGVQGSGKTAIAINLGLQEIKAGASLICLDPSTGADMIRDIISRMPADKLEKTYYLTIKEESKLYAKHPFSLNIFGYPNPGSVGIEARAAAKNQIILAFDKLFPATDGVYFQEILRNLIPLLLDHPTFTLFDIEDFLLDDSFRLQILEQIENPRVTRYWYRFAAGSNTEKNKLIGPFLRRLGQLLGDDFIPYHIGQKRGALDIRQAILNGEILLIHLPLDDMAYRTAAPVMGTLLMMQIYAATFSFGNLDRDKRPNFCLLVDEFTKWVYDSGDEFKDLFSLGRKYGISQVLLMQYTSQLDEQNLKSLKDGITSAKTFISLRSTLQDGPHLAPRFTGLKRRPTDIYIDVLDRLEKHPNAFVKEFYWHTVKPLQQAARFRDDSYPSPSCDFGFGNVKFTPSTAQSLVEELNNLLYYSQKEERVKPTQAFLEKYGWLTGGIQTKIVDDEYVIGQMEKYIKIRQNLDKELQENFDIYEKRSRAEVAAYHTELKKAVSLFGNEDYPDVRGKIHSQEQLIYQAKREIKELREKANDPYVIGEQNKNKKLRWFEEPITRDDSGEKKIITHRYLSRSELTAEIGFLIRVLETSIAGYEENIAELQKWIIKWKQLCEKHKQEIEVFQKPYNEKLHIYRAEQDRLDKLTQKIIQVEHPALKKVMSQLQQVLIILIAEPLAADKSELSASDIASLLPHVADRHGYIKTPSGVYAMKTTDLSRPVPLDETSTRWNTILSQTKKKYCQKGRAEINQEIKSAFKNSLRAQEKTKEPENRKLKEETSPQKQPKKKSQDVFDMLDENESTE